MELRERLSVTRRGMMIVVAATVGAVVGCAVSLFPVDPTYRTVAVIGTDPNAVNANERVDFVNDMRVAMFQPSVIDGISSEVGISGSDLRSSLTIGRIRDSNLIQLTFVGSDPDERVPRDVVTLAPQKALELLRRGEIEAASSLVDRLEKDRQQAITALEGARQAVAEAVRANGFVPPDVTLDALRGQVAELALQLRITPLGSDLGPVLQGQYDDLQNDLARATGDAEKYQTLVDAQQQAVAERSSVEAALTTARQSLATSRSVPPVTVQIVAAKTIDRRSAMLQLVVITVFVLLASLLVTSWWEKRKVGSLRTAISTSDRSRAFSKPVRSRDSSRRTTHGAKGGRKR